MIVHSVFCFTLLFVCVGAGVNSRLVLGCLTGLGAGLWLWLGHGQCLSYASEFHQWGVGVGLVVGFLVLDNG